MTFGLTRTMRVAVLLISGGMFVNACGSIPRIPFDDDEENDSETPAANANNEKPDTTGPTTTDGGGIALNTDPVDPENRFRSSEIKRIYFEGSFVGLEEVPGATDQNDDSRRLLFNFNSDRTKGAPLAADVEQDGTLYKISLPARKQRFIEVGPYNALLRYRDASNDTADAFLIRKADGKTWNIANLPANATSFSYVRGEGEDRVYFTTSAYKWTFDFWSERSGDMLYAVRIPDQASDVTLLKVVESDLDDYHAIGADSVIIDTDLSGIWISGLTAPKPVPYKLSSVGKSYMNYQMNDHLAFSLRDQSGETHLMVHTDHPAEGDDAGVVPGRPYSLYWSMDLGSVYLFKTSGKVVWVDKGQRKIAGSADVSESIDYPDGVVSRGSKASLYTSGRVCQFQYAGSNIEHVCIESTDLSLRGSLSAIEMNDQGQILVYSSIESVNDVERLTLNVDYTQGKITLLKREPVSSYNPESSILVPVVL